MPQQETVSAQISGNSMAPFYCDGDIVSVDLSAYRDHEINVGDIVLAAHPYIRNHYIVKKVTEVAEEKVFLLGINQEESTDSRHFGKISKEKIIGKILSKEKGLSHLQNFST